MKKQTSSQIEVTVKILEEEFDNQYTKTIQALGNTEIQLNLESKLSEISKLQVFKKRDKLQHSPESHPNSQNIFKEDEASTQGMTAEKPSEKNDFREKLNSLLRQTEYQIYQFDQVLNSKSSQQDCFNKTIEQDIENCFQKSQDCVIINLFKSNTIMDFTIEDHSKQQGIELALNKIFEQTRKSKNDALQQSASKIFDTSPYYKDISFSVFTLNSFNKIQDLLTNNQKQCNNLKELFRQNSENQEDFMKSINSIKSQVMNKKIQLSWICYQFKIQSNYDNGLPPIKITLLDFINPLEKIPDKGDFQDKKIDFILEPFITPIKVLYRLFTYQKGEQHIRDKFFQILTKIWKNDAKFHFIANLHPIDPFYNQNMLMILLLTDIMKKRDVQDPLFYHMIFNKLKETTNKKQQVKLNNEKMNSSRKSVDSERLIQAQEEKQKLQEELKQANQKLEQLTNTNESLKEEINYIKNKSSSYIQEIKNSYGAEKKSLESQITELQSKIKKDPFSEVVSVHQQHLEDEIDSLKIQNKQFKQEMVTQDRLSEQQKQEIKTLETKVSNMLKLNDQLQEQLLQKEEQIKKQQGLETELKLKYLEKNEKEEEEMIQENPLQQQKQIQFNSAMLLFTEYLQREKEKISSLISLMDEANKQKVQILKDEINVLQNQVSFYQEMILYLLKDNEKLHKKATKLQKDKTQFLGEMNQRFKDLKEKMVVKLSSKNQEINRYEKYFGDVEQKLKDIDSL